ncbi:MAG: bifunctional phosphoribosylaminoimidazolecarboxamide formyltransferase/IMP cyclohydrolase [Paludibacteraceae bacterium]|nr:bifunctional phosphoribosylaminoimidazolecarboxamide formyltransferase/IMP cyclohydrolase [Paludibacteraceae bacterium]
MAKRALVSVSDKTGLVDFVKGLQTAGWEIIATGGTQKLLEDSGVKTIGISDVTGFPEICDGRVKTLHPKVHGGLLARRDEPSHLQALQENGIEFIDLVCVNLYPFRETIAKEGTTMAEAIEKIDIGGPSMLRSAAKNYNDVTVVCDPADYDTILAEINATGNTTLETRLQLSAKAYTHTAQYDCCIATYMREKAGLNEKLFLEFDLKQGLRYGENPHQSAKFYASTKVIPFSLASGKQLQGKEMSYNNIQDANAALNIARDFQQPFCVALKHMNPCGAAVAETIEEAWQKAYEADTVSIYGGIVICNRTITKEIALGMKPIFLEIVIAPDFTDEAMEIFATKKNLRVIQVDMTPSSEAIDQYVSVNGGLLVQHLDTQIETITADMCATKVQPDAATLADMQFGWNIVKHVKSNAIVVVKNGQTLGVGAGQMNRVGSAEIAMKQAHAAGVTEGLILASDGFLPFDDTVALAAKYGVTAIVQPGGSIRDNDCIVKADELGICMLMTGTRHFKH